MQLPQSDNTSIHASVVAVTNGRQLVYGPDNDKIIAIRAAIVRNYLATRSWWREEFTQASARPPHVENDVHRHTVKRYNDSLTYIVPWVIETVGRIDCRVLEIGCGTGSSTAAFSFVCDSINGYDIDAPSVQAAEARLAVLGIANAEVAHVPADSITPTIAEKYGESSFDIVIMYAVLEHQTLTERLDALATYWNMVRPGGHLVIIETPNRLTYFDWHTSRTSFFHLLPIELQMLYSARSSRREFVDNVKLHKDKSEGAALGALMRWGQGVSFHEFDLAIGDTRPLVVADGFSPHILKLRPFRAEEMLLHNYFLTQKIAAAPGFARYSLDLILRKPESAP